MEKLSVKQKGPNLGVLACIFMILFIAGLSYVVSFSPGNPSFPSPWGSLEDIDRYFKNNAHAAFLCAFFQFGSAIPLGLFTATVVSRLQYLGVNGPGAYIALFGGLITSLNVILSSLMIWTMSLPFISGNPEGIRLLYYVGFGIGGVGYSVPLGLLIAGIAVPSLIMRLLPRWLAILGLLIALVGEMSWLSLIFPKLVALIPLTRFPGFIWLILTGFYLPRAAQK
jgi:hypothetical protein